MQRNWPLGPYLDFSWEENWPYRTWEINWPTPDPWRWPSRSPAWPTELVGLMDFEIEEWIWDDPGCHI